MDNIAQAPPSDKAENAHADEWEEFEKACRPAVEFLQKRYCTPHHHIIIDWDRATLVKDLKGLPFKCPD